MKDFEKSPATLESELHVRKKPFLIAGVTHPGLIGIHGQIRDTVAFLLVCALEIIGASFFAQALLDADMDGAVPAIVGTIVVVFLADLIFAFFHHIFSTGKVTKLKARRIVVGQSDDGQAGIEIKRIDDVIKQKTRLAFVFSMLIIGFALFKFYFYMQYQFFVFGPDQTDGGSLVAMFLVYSVAAYIHINHTGYFMAMLWTWWLERQDKEKFDKSDGKDCRAQIRLQTLTDNADYSSAPQVGEHKIEKRKLPNRDDELYVLVTNGVLMDKEIEQFAGRLTDSEAKRTLALKSLEHQLNNLPA